MGDLVVGCSVGTGWVVLVSLAAEGSAEPDQLTVVDRCRLELVSGPDRFVYHLAADRDLPDGERLVSQVRAEATAAATEALRTLRLTTVSHVDPGSSAPGRAVVVGPPPGASPALADIVSAHTAIHTAEGELYRSVMRDAFAALGLAVDAVPRRGLLARVAEDAGVDRSAVEATVDGWRRILGPPWRKEQKEAALAAWWSLARPAASGISA